MLYWVISFVALVSSSTIPRETLSNHNWKHRPLYEDGESPPIPQRFDNKGDEIRGMIARDDNEGSRRSLQDLSNGPDNQVDVLILYGNTQYVAEVGAAGMHSQIERMIQWANYALENSGVFTAGFNLVGSARLDNYLESEDPFERDFFLYATGSDVVSQLREEYSADLVCYFCTDHWCGGALQSFTGTATTGAQGDPEYDYLCDFTSRRNRGGRPPMHRDLVDSRWDGSDGVLIHEMGHNLGCSHDDPASEHAENTYSYGWASTTLHCRDWTTQWPGFFTIMSGGHAACECADQCTVTFENNCFACYGRNCCNVGNPSGRSCLEGHCGDYALNVFSAPDILDPVWGVPTGRRRFADNAAQLRAEWMHHANFRHRGQIRQAHTPRGADYFECSRGQCWYMMKNAFTWGHGCNGPNEPSRCPEEISLRNRGDSAAQSRVCHDACANNPACVGYQRWYNRCWLRFEWRAGVPSIDSDSWCSPNCADAARRVDCRSVEECRALLGETGDDSSDESDESSDDNNEEYVPPSGCRCVPVDHPSWGRIDSCTSPEGSGFEPFCYVTGSCARQPSSSVPGAFWADCVMNDGSDPAVDCVGSWSGYGSCSATCGSGVQSRTYTITTNAENGGSQCPHLNGATQTRNCNNDACPTAVDCVGSWSGYGSCSATCGSGVQSRTYTVTTNAENGGSQCPHLNGATQTRNCNNDACPSNSLQCGDSVTGSTRGLSSQIGNPSGEATFEFTADGGMVTFDLCGSRFDTYIRILDTSGSEIAHNDDHGNQCDNPRHNYASFLERQLPAGVYTVVVEGYSRNEGDFALEVKCRSAGGDDEDTISCGQTVRGSTRGRPSSIGSRSGEMTYQFVATTTQYVFDACQSSYDSYLRVYSGTPSTGRQIARNDDHRGRCPRGSRRTASYLTVSTTVGQTYTLLIEGYGRSEGNFVVTAECPSSG